MKKFLTYFVLLTCFLPGLAMENDPFAQPIQEVIDENVIICNFCRTGYYVDKSKQPNIYQHIYDSHMFDDICGICNKPALELDKHIAEHFMTRDRIKDQQGFRCLKESELPLPVGTCFSVDMFVEFIDAFDKFNFNEQNIFDNSSFSALTPIYPEDQFSFSDLDLVEIAETEKMLENYQNFSNQPIQMPTENQTNYFRCNVCQTFIFPSEGKVEASLYDHIKLAHIDENVCTYCQKEFISAEQYMPYYTKQHIEQHIDEIFDLEGSKFLVAVSHRSHTAYGNKNVNQPISHQFVDLTDETFSTDNNIPFNCPNFGGQPIDIKGLLLRCTLCSFRNPRNYFTLDINDNNCMSIYDHIKNMHIINNKCTYCNLEVDFSKDYEHANQHIKDFWNGNNGYFLLSGNELIKKIPNGTQYITCYVCVDNYQKNGGIDNDFHIFPCNEKSKNILLDHCLTFHKENQQCTLCKQVIKENENIKQHFFEHIGNLNDSFSNISLSNEKIYFKISQKKADSIQDFDSNIQSQTDLARERRLAVEQIRNQSRFRTSRASKRKQVEAETNRQKELVEKEKTINFRTSSYNINLNVNNVNPPSAKNNKQKALIEPFRYQNLFMTPDSFKRRIEEKEARKKRKK
ncbi:MAG: hypothetical protein WDZ41_04335 [Candidatus Babeliales bacterium]